MTSADDLRARIDLFEQATSYAVDLLTTVGPTDLLRPTPCQGWDVGAVVLHVADAADAVIGWMATGRLYVPTPRALTTEMPVDVACDRNLLAYLGRRPGRRPGTSARHRVGTSIEADR